MRRLIRSFSLCFCLIMIGQQLSAQIQLGGGLVFGTGVNRIGFNVKGTYEINEKFLAAPGVNFFFKDKPISDATIGYFSVDLDARYHLIAVGDDIIIYPVGGINIFNVKVDGVTTGVRLRREDGLKVGLNLGLGTQIATLSDWSYFGEFKVTVGGIDQSTITAGVLYGF